MKLKCSTLLCQNLPPVGRKGKFTYMHAVCVILKITPRNKVVTDRDTDSHFTTCCGRSNPIKLPSSNYMYCLSRKLTWLKEPTCAGAQPFLYVVQKHHLIQLILVFSVFQSLYRIFHQVTGKTLTISNIIQIAPTVGIFLARGNVVRIAFSMTSQLQSQVNSLLRQTVPCALTINNSALYLAHILWVSHDSHDKQ